MPSSLLSLLLASLLLVSQSDASVQSLVNAVDDMKNITNTILNPEAWKSQDHVLSRFASQRPSADKTAVGEAMDRKIAALTARVAAMQNELHDLTKTVTMMDSKLINLTKILAEENHRYLMEATTAMDRKIAILTRSFAEQNQRLLTVTKAIADEKNRNLQLHNWCPWPWRLVRSDLCISTSHERADWAAGISKCRRYGGSLVTFRNWEDYKAVIMGNVRVFYCPWVGIRWEGNANKFYGPKENNFVYKLSAGSITNACAAMCRRGMYYVPCTEKKVVICVKKRP